MLLLLHVTKKIFWGDERLLILGAFWAGAYSRWPLIQRWALIRISTVFTSVSTPSAFKFLYFSELPFLFSVHEIEKKFITMSFKSDIWQQWKYGYLKKRSVEHSFKSQLGNLEE